MEIVRGSISEVQVTPEPDLLSVTTLTPIGSTGGELWRALVSWDGRPNGRIDFHIPVAVDQRVVVYSERGLKAELNLSTGEFYPHWPAEQLRRQIILGLIGAPFVVGLIYLIYLWLTRRAYKRMREAANAELVGWAR